MSKFGTLSLGLALAAPLAAAERPAVRMLPATPMDACEAISTIKARAASNSGFDPFPQPPRNDASRIRSMLDSKLDRDEPAGENNWTKFTKWMGDRAKSVKEALNAPAPQPEPRIGQTQPVRKLFQPQSPPPREPAKVNAADPAYRWYGWGTVTPGANQFAPAGDYPPGSAQWYTQTGATPGAFPVPTMNPYRPEPGSSPPAYMQPTPPPVVSAPPPPMTPVIIPPPSYAPPPAAVPAPVRRTIAETPAPEVPKVAPAMPTNIAPTAPVPVPPPAETQGKAKYEPRFIPVKAEEPVIMPVIRGQEPSLDDSPLAREIAKACQGLATKVSIRETGPRRLVISFTATTQSLADLAVQATSRVAALKPYDVQFAAKVSQ